MIKIRRVFVAIFIFLMVYSFSLLSKEEKDLTQLAISYIQKNFRETRGLSLHVTEINDLKLLSKTRIMRISTAEIIPFKNWYVAIDDSGNPFLLNYNNLKGFNQFIIREQLKLKSKKDYLDFIEVFLLLTCANESLIESGDLRDKTRIKDEFKNIKILTKIEEAQNETARLTFFSVNSIGSIKMWRLIVKKTGEIEQLKKTDLAYN